jgi:hypothetical protein
VLVLVLEAVLDGRFDQRAQDLRGIGALEVDESAARLSGS